MDEARPQGSTPGDAGALDDAGWIAGLGAFETPSLEVVERRRRRLWFLTVAVFLSAAAGLVLLGLQPGPVPFVLTTRQAQMSLLVLTALFSAYALEKETALRRLTALLIEERVLTASLTSRVRELSTLLEAGKALNLDVDFPRVLSRILSSARDLLDARDGSVMLVRQDDELLTIATVGESFAAGARQSVGEGIAGRVAATREPLLINGRVHPGNGPQARDRPESAMSAPLIHRGEVLGVLNVNAPSERRYTEHDLRALSFFAEQAAAAVANAQLLENERLTATQGIFRALHDPLTNLPNRALFHERLRHALTRRSAPGERHAVVFLDLKAFKEVNDRFGHSVGDRVLIDTAARLRSVCRGGDTIARLGGDEFALLLERVEGRDRVEGIARRLEAVFDEPLRVGEHNLRLAARIGVGLAPDSGGTAEDLMRAADDALRAAREGGATVIRQDPTARVPQGDPLSRISGALERDELEIHYQPIVDLASRAVVGFEALLRWHHPELGLLSADAFIAETERAGLLPSIDLWTLDRACRLAAGLEAGTDRPPAVHVNLLPTRLHHGETPMQITEALSRAGLAPERLVLEITENHLLLDVARASSRLEELRELGVKIALDDFGTGYSSLSYLRSLPVTMVKMDRLFIQDLGTEGPATPLVEAILSFAKGLGLDVVAEGIESAEQLDALVGMGCRLGQGFLLARPQPRSDLERLLQRR